MSGDFVIQVCTWSMGLLFVGVIFGLENCKPGKH